MSESVSQSVRERVTYNDATHLKNIYIGRRGSQSFNKYFWKKGTIAFLSKMIHSCKVCILSSFKGMNVLQIMHQYNIHNTHYVHQKART